MAPTEINNGDIIELCTGLPEVSIPIECPLFKCMGSVWNFKLTMIVYDSHSRFYKATLNKSENTRFLKPFKIDVEVGITHDENLSLGKKTISFSGNGYIVWESSQSNLKKKLPQDYRTGNILKFLFRFHLPSDPVIKVNSKSQNLPGNHVRQVDSATYMHLEALSTDFSNLLQNTTISDVKIICEGKEFKAHRIVLGTRSEVFSAMFRSKMVEDETGVIEVKEIKASIFECFLSYLYSGKLPKLDFEIAVQLYKVGDRYAVVKLKRSCSDYLTENLSEGNAYEMLVLADHHSDVSFTNDVISYIVDRKFPQHDPQWLNFCKNHPHLAIMVQNKYIEKHCTK